MSGELGVPEVAGGGKVGCDAWRIQKRRTQAGCVRR